MVRTTLNIDEPILRDLKRLQKKEKKSLGQLVSDLLAWAIRAQEADDAGTTSSFAWKTRPMEARVDLADKETLWAVLDEKGLDETVGLDEKSQEPSDG